MPQALFLSGSLSGLRMSLPMWGTGQLMSNICGEEKGLQSRKAKMFHLLSDNYLIPSLLLSALVFDLVQVCLQDKHEITGECNEFKSPILYCYMCN